MICDCKAFAAYAVFDFAELVDVDFGWLFAWWSRRQGAFRGSMCLLKYFIIRKIWAFPCALSLCSVAPGRYVTGSAFAPASALSHFIRSLAGAAFGALHSANAFLIVENSKYLTYNAFNEHCDFK